jgi:CRISPR-associated protein Cas2
MIFFDLPTITHSDGQNYRSFHKYLIKTGFIMTQYSVYSKLVLNASAAHAVKVSLRKHLPPKGNIQCLQVTEKQFADIEYMVGKSQTKIIDSIDRWLEIE